MHHTFWYTSLPLLHDYDVEMPYFKFTENITKAWQNFTSLYEIG